MTLGGHASSVVRVSAVPPAIPTRLPRREDAFRVPRALTDDGTFVIDATWGTIQPIALAQGVRTVGELELIDHMQRGLPVIDTRSANDFDERTIPGALNIPHADILHRITELDPDHETVLFCNGPQCSATPDAIRRLLDAGHPAPALLYYRGGLRDWMTLGFATADQAVAGSSS